MGIIAMGRLGGHELGYGSATPTCSSSTTRCPACPTTWRRTLRYAVAEELRRLLQLPSPDPPLLVDADLRPEGRQGRSCRIAGRLPGVLRALVAGLGGAGAAAGSPLAGDDALAAQFLERCRPVR